LAGDKKGLYSDQFLPHFFTREWYKINVIYLSGLLFRTHRT